MVILIKKEILSTYFTLNSKMITLLLKKGNHDINVATDGSDMLCVVESLFKSQPTLTLHLYARKQSQPLLLKQNITKK